MANPLPSWRFAQARNRYGCNPFPHLRQAATGRGNVPDDKSPTGTTNFEPAIGGRGRVQDVWLHVVDRGSGDRVLLVHGFPLDHTMRSGQIARLAEPARVIAPDLRGFGQSDVSSGTQTMPRMADELAGLIDALAIDQPVFCGLSMGGYIACDFRPRHGRRLSCADPLVRLTISVDSPFLHPVVPIQPPHCANN